MTLPVPIPGLVVQYSFLWHQQRERGLDEGTKERPCVIVSLEACPDGTTLVAVAPITHHPPTHPTIEHVEMPRETKRRLGLDEVPSWIVVTEVNHFVWPGYDLRTVPGKRAGEFAYGFVPPGLLRQVRERLLETAGQGLLLTAPR